MSRSFPIQFDTDRFVGARGRQFPKPADAFQQLVGDGLKALFGVRATVTPTGGPDGAIDIFVDEPADRLRETLGVVAPAIVECKYHDTELRDWESNLAAGWRKVEIKLRTEAEAGWSGELHRPWHRARSYLYCASVSFPNQAARDKLAQRIRSFFETIPGLSLPPENVSVVGWSDLRDWLETLPRVADAWLGTGLETIREHRQFLEGLTGFRASLRETKLPLVPPPADSEFHPDRILKRLGTAQSGSGILLVGAGGVGKTRTLIEVASRAADTGWRVLHGTAKLTADDLAQSLAQASAPTLLLLDYVDQMEDLDPDEVRQAIISGGNGLERVVILAAARPGFLIRDTPWGTFLRHIAIQPDPVQRMEIVNSIVESEAKTASAVLGIGRVSHLSGRNPIIALLIAQDLERRATRGELTADTAAEFTSVDLVSWLRGRLERDDLKTKAAGGAFRRNAVEPHLVAVAAMFARAPGTAGELVTLGAQALAKFTRNEPAAAALEREVRGTLESVMDLGWVEFRSDHVAVVHDVIADSVVSDVLMTGDRLRREVLWAILASADLETLPVMLRVLGRVRTALPNSAKRSGFGAGLREWLQEHAAEVGQSLAALPRRGFRVLRIMAAEQVWREAMAQEWAPLVEPLLKACPHEPYAREFLREALYSLPNENVRSLIPAALDWIGQLYTRREAIMVLVPLIHRAGTDEAELVERLALAFVRRHMAAAIPSGVVLYRLMKRRQPIHGDQVAKVSESWLQRHGNSFDAQYVITALIIRGGILSSSRLNHYVAEWLTAYSDQERASHVIRALLLRHADKALPARIEEAIAVWLALASEHAKTGEIYALMVKVQLARPARILASLLSWLARFGNRAPREPFYILMRNAVQAHDRAPQAAIGWLEKYADTQQAQIVISALLSLGSSISSPELDAAVHRWMDQYWEDPGAGFLFSGMLHPSRAYTPDGTFEEWALAWIRKHPGLEQAGFVLYFALRRPALACASEWEQTAVDWLAGREAEPRSHWVLRALLKRRGGKQDPQVVRQVVAAAAVWLSHNSSLDTLVGGIFGPLLKREDLLPSERDVIVPRAYAHLEEFGLTPSACHVLEGLLRRNDLRAAERLRAAELSQDWLSRHAGDPTHKAFAAEYRAFLSAAKHDASIT